MRSENRRVKDKNVLCSWNVYSLEKKKNNNRLLKDRELEKKVTTCPLVADPFLELGCSTDGIYWEAEMLERTLWKVAVWKL